MKTYQYTDETNTVVHIIEEDGISRSSCLVSIAPGGAEILPYVPPPAPPVTVISMRQARLALHQAGMLASVQAAIDAQDEPLKTQMQIEWDYASEVARQWPTLLALAPALGLSDAQVDALFTLAATL